MVRFDSVVVLTLLKSISWSSHTQKTWKTHTQKKKTGKDKFHNRIFDTTDFKPNDPFVRAVRVPVRPETGYASDVYASAIALWARGTQDWQALFTQSVSPQSPAVQSKWSVLVSDARWLLWTVRRRTTDGGITQTTLTRGIRWVLCVLITVIGRLITVSAVFIVWHRIYLTVSWVCDLNKTTF